MAEPPDEVDLLYGCARCGKTTMVEGVPSAQLIFPRGLEFDCRGCGASVGLLSFDSAEQLAQALERDLPGGPSGRAQLRWQVRHPLDDVS